MQVAQQLIDEMEAVEMPLDCSTGEPLVALGLRGEYAIQAALPLLQNPEQAMVQYEIACVSLVSVFKSKVTSRDDPWLPNPTDLFSFFGKNELEADVFADTLSKSAEIYGKLTGGGGSGVPTLYRAELAHRRNDFKTAATLARKAQAEINGDLWMKPIIEKLTSVNN